jgi:hypothetical protein
MRRRPNLRSPAPPAWLYWKRRLSAPQCSALLAILGAAAALCGARLSSATEHPLSAPGIFDSDPNHIWNRTYGCLLIRQAADGTAYGVDALDPPLWPETNHLLTGDSHRRALACLDEFLRSHAERDVQDPLKRAIFQRDLWAVFDWAAAGDDLPRERRELESRLAQAIRRVALAPEQIGALPDTYAAAVAAQQFATAYDPQHAHQPFLPPELFHSNGPWVCLSAHLEEPTAIVHFYFSGRSRFLVFMRLPEGRDATLAYVHKLRSSSLPPLTSDAQGHKNLLLNLALPQFPAGTQVALVRQAIVLDAEGKLLPTALTESVQLRVYHAVTPGTPYQNYINGPSSRDQDFFEFRMSRPALFAGRNGGLVAVHPGEKEYATFQTHGTDEFDSRHPLEGQSEILMRCVGCHSDSGIHAVQSRIQWMKPAQGAGGPTTLAGLYDPIRWESDVTIAHKQQEPDFRLLQTFWGRGRD